MPRQDRQDTTGAENIDSRGFQTDAPVHALPDELLLDVFLTIAATATEYERLKLLWVCRRWRALALDVSLWPARPVANDGYYDLRTATVLASACESVPRMPRDAVALMGAGADDKSRELRLAVMLNANSLAYLTQRLPAEARRALGRITTFTIRDTNTREWRADHDTMGSMHQLFAAYAGETLTSLDMIVARKSNMMLGPEHRATEKAEMDRALSAIFQRDAPILRLALSYAGPIETKVLPPPGQPSPMLQALAEFEARGITLREGFLSGNNYFVNLRRLTVEDRYGSRLARSVEGAPPPLLEQLTIKGLGVGADFTFASPSLQALHLCLVDPDPDSVPNSAQRARPPFEISRQFPSLTKLTLEIAETSRELAAWVPTLLASLPREHPLAVIVITGKVPHAFTPFGKLSPEPPARGARFAKHDLGHGWTLQVHKLYGGRVVSAAAGGTGQLEVEYRLERGAAV